MFQDFEKERKNKTIYKPVLTFFMDREFMSIKIGSSDGKVVESVVIIAEGFSHSFSFPQAAFNELLKQ